MSENIREIVLDSLLAVERREDFSHRLLKAVLDKYNYLDARDKSFIKRLFEGTIERRIELDYYLNHFSSVKVNKMKPLIRCLLRMSVYQLVYMDTVPDSAVCNEACKLADKRKFHNLKGFVNGILRNIAKNRDNLPMPDPNKEGNEYLSVKYSMPLWIVEKWVREFGNADTVKILEGMMQVHPVSIRFSAGLSPEDREKIISGMEKEGVEVTKSPYLPYMYNLTHVDGISSLPGYEEGYFSVQDVSSALCVEAAGIGDTDEVIDVCAAPGGKSLLAAERAKKVLSRDVSVTKVDIINENIARMKLENVYTEVFDATCFDEALVESGDVVLMDVPCSGLGVMGKKRDIKYNVSPDSLDSINELQKRIFENSWQYVKKGGVLIYSTCTINSTENEEMVKWITANYPFREESLTGLIPDNVLALSGADGGHVNLLPGFMDCDGFFFARLRRI